MVAVYLRLRNAADTINLNSVSMNGFGVEATKGVTGLGLPPVSVQYLTGAGDGAKYRGRRVQPRDIDIPLYFYMPDRASLEDELDRMAFMLADEFDLDVVDGGVYWTTRAARVSGGDFAYGEGTTGEREFRTVVTVRCGDPFFSASRPEVARVDNAGAGRGLLNGGLTHLQVSASQAIGTMTLANSGAVEAWPEWEVAGPGNVLDVRLPDGTGFTWTGPLAAGDKLLIDAKTASVKNAAGVSQYSKLSPAPRFFPIPKGTTLATVSLTGTTADSYVKCSWYPRKWWKI